MQSILIQSYNHLSQFHMLYHSHISGKFCDEDFLFFLILFWIYHNSEFGYFYDFFRYPYWDSSNSLQHVYYSPQLDSPQFFSFSLSDHLCSAVHLPMFASPSHAAIVPLYFTGYCRCFRLCALIWRVGALEPMQGKHVNFVFLLLNYIYQYNIFLFYYLKITWFPFLWMNTIP